MTALPRSPLPTPRVEASRRSGLTLIELLVVLIVGLILVGFLVNSVVKARQRGLVTALQQDGARTTNNDDGTVRMLDISKLPPDKLGDNLDRMARLKNLYALNLDHAAVTHTELEPLLAEMDLAQLHLVGTDITDAAIEVITRQKRLGVIDLRATFITDAGVKELTTLTGLHNIRLSETRITDAALAHLVLFPRLTILDLRATAVSNAGLARLREMPNLRTVRLTGTGVTMDAAVALKRDRPQLRVEFEEWNSEWVNLRFAKHLDNQEVERVLSLPPTDESLRTLARIRVEQCHLGIDAAPDCLTRLGRLRALRRLRLTGAWVTDDALADLWHNRRLTGITAIKTPLTDACVQHIARCRLLNALDLSGTAVTGATLGQLKSCRHLFTLNLSELTLCDEAFDQLATLKTLTSLNLIHTPARDDQLAKLADLNLSQLRINGGRRYRGTREVQRYLHRLRASVESGENQ